MSSEELKKEWVKKLLLIIEQKHCGLGLCDTMFEKTIVPFVNLLLAKQQEEVVNIIKNRTGVIAYADTDKGTVERILISRDDLLADIKSKLNK